MNRTLAARFSVSLFLPVIFAASVLSQDLTTVASFNGANGDDPLGDLVAYGSYIYGTTWRGGAQNGGTVFKINRTTGELTTIRSFDSMYGAGDYKPRGLMIHGSYIYGTTDTGLLYRLDPANDSIVSFARVSSGAHSPPVENGGFLYGTTYFGGGEGKSGTLYRVELASGNYTTLATFAYPKGRDPHATPLVVGSFLYGTTEDGGPGGGDGIVYKFNLTTGEFTVVPWSDSSYVGFINAGLVPYGRYLFGNTTGGRAFRVDVDADQATQLPITATFGSTVGTLVSRDQYFYGSAVTGGEHGYGGIYRFDPVTFERTMLVSFDGPNYRYPASKLLVIGPYLYGSTSEGGPGGKGVIFRYNIAQATTTTLESSVTPTAYGAPATFTACVAPIPNGGSVTFLDGANVIGTSNAGANGCAALTASSLLPGTHSISATYTGNDDFKASTSNVVSQSVDETDTTTTLSSSLNPSRSGYSLTLTANVTPPPPGGTVEFREGANILGTANVVNGIARMAAAFAEGSHDIVAAYGGNGGFHASTSATLTQVVGPVSKAKSDLNGDGKSDIVLQNGTTNAVAVWMMNGAVMTSAKNVATPAADWKVAATGDVDGDGKSDILLKNNATRAIAVWRMDGATILSGLTIATPAVDWRIATAADFTADGKADLILQNAAGAIAQWQMNGSTITLGRVIATPAPELQVITAANFAGTPGLILQNSSTGAIERWLMSGTTVTSNATVATPAAGWKVKAAGDFTGDGVAELVVQNDSTAAISIWSLDSSGVFAGEHVIATPAIAWKVIGTADYDDDGRADILLRNTSDNRVAIWTTDGTTLLSGRVVATPVAGWIPVLK